MKRAAGFSLVELLVVAAILALIGAAAGPSLARLQAGHQNRLELNRVEDFLASAPNTAFVRGEGLRLVGEGRILALEPDGPRLTLAPRWHIEVPEALRYGSNGAAGGGVVRVATESSVARYRVLPGSGRVIRDD